MTTIVEAEKYVLYLLTELGAANEHHRFEDVCARLARIRVSSNIILATGPVSAGGDQGRDAESYFTRLPDEMPGAGGFIGQASTCPIVVACTVQKTSIPSKIKSDLDAICTQGEPVEHVAFFSTAAVAKKAQHDCQAYARETHQVHLDVFDGPTIARMLVEPDATWIAQNLLDLPESMVPERASESTTPDWYASDLAAARDLSHPLQSAGDAASITAGLRYAVGHPELAGDLGDWMRAAERLIDAAGEDHLSASVATRCRYELIFASVRGAGSFSARIDEHARTLLESAINSDDPGLHLDASVVLMCCGGMWGRHGTSLIGRELQAYHRRLRDRVDELVASVDRSVHRLRHARLIAAAAHLAMHPRWDKVEPPPPGTIPSVFAEEELDASTLSPVDNPPIDIDEALGRLAAFADVASDARGLPIQQLSKIFDLLAPLFAADSRYPQIRDTLDAATAELHGDIEAGTRARDRGIALRETGRPLLALRELHEAKIRWFHGDTLRGALLTLIVIANVYRDLGLPHAAKQYALAAAAAAMTAAEPEEVEDIVAPAIAQGSIASYNAGAWFDAIALGNIGRMAHAHLAEHAFDYDEHAELRDIDLTELFVVSAAQAYRPRLLDSLERMLTDFGTWDAVRAALSEAGGYPWSEAEFNALTAEQLTGVPFSDTGPQRLLRFAALGAAWNIGCAQDKATVLAAERLAAAAQVLIADLALLDPVFFPSQMDIFVSTDAPTGEPVQCGSIGDRVVWRVCLPRYNEDQPSDEFEKELMSVAVQLLATVSALPQGAFLNKVAACAKAGLFNRIVVGRPYDSVTSLLNESHYANLAELPSARIGNADSRATTAPELTAPTSPGPGYDQADALERAQWRYDHLPSLIRQTLPRIQADPDIRTHLANLRSEGWLDWQLLLAVQNLAANARVRDAGYDARNPAHREQILRIFKEPETENGTPLPLSEFSPASIVRQLEVGLTVACEKFGLAVHMPIHGAEEIAWLLRTRYGYGTDDVPHDRLFALDG